MSKYIQDIIEAARELRDAQIEWNRFTRDNLLRSMGEGELERACEEADEVTFRLGKAKVDLYKSLDKWDNTNYLEQIEEEFGIIMDIDNGKWSQF